ncbi:MAG: DUF134 domain-containing protein [Thermodesulfobacteriota bacterium]
MPRPRRCRLVQGAPPVTYFKPQGIPLRDLAEVCLGVDGFEALRMADLEGRATEEAAARMGVSRLTLNRILGQARVVAARALSRGWACASRAETGFWPARPMSLMRQGAGGTEASQAEEECAMNGILRWNGRGRGGRMFGPDDGQGQGGGRGGGRCGRGRGQDQGQGRCGRGGGGGMGQDGGQGQDQGRRRGGGGSGRGGAGRGQGSGAGPGTPSRDAGAWRRPARVRRRDGSCLGRRCE